MQFMKIRPMHFRNLLALSALTSLFWLGTPASAQTVPAQGNTSVQDNDITRQELARFDQFLDGHRYIAEELRKDPSLIDSREYMQNHPDLQAFPAGPSSRARGDQGKPRCVHEAGGAI